MSKIKDLNLEVLNGNAYDGRSLVDHFNLDWWIEELQGELEDGNEDFEVYIPSIGIGQLEELQEMGLFRDNIIVLKEIIDNHDYDGEVNNEFDGYTQIQVIGGKEITILGGGEYDKKVELNEEQLKAQEELENEGLVEYNPKYEDAFLISKNEYNGLDNWIEDNIDKIDFSNI